jgi:hypothetical protein
MSSELKEELGEILGELLLLSSRTTGLKGKPLGK